MQAEGAGLGLAHAGRLGNARPMGTFAQDIVVEPVGPGRYAAVLDESWNLVPLPQGGVVTSLALRAASDAVADPSHQLRSSTTTFAGQVRPGELEIEVTVLRHGRSATQATASIRNVGAPAGAFVTAVFGTSRRGPSFVDLTMPEVAPPERCPSGRAAPPEGVEADLPPPFWTRVEGRLALGHDWWEDFELTTSDRATWLRFDDPPIDPEGALDPLGLLTLADRMPGAVQERIGRQEERWFAPSADLTVHFFAPLTTPWVLAHDRARWADDGWASGECTLWSEDGTLVGYATQMMLFTYPFADG